MELTWTLPSTFMSTRSPFFREEEQLKAILEGNKTWAPSNIAWLENHFDKSPFFRENEHIYKDITNNKKEESSMLGIQVLFTKIQKVIYNNPATIVFWNDGTKTVVKCCKDDTYDPEKGLLMAIIKKSFRDSNDFHKELKRWSIHTNPQLWSYRNNCMVTIERDEK